MKDNSYIYFLTNHYNNVLYVGVTNDIVRRVAEHKAKVNKGFTYQYNCDKLVYYEIFPLMTAAIKREKQLKNWKREWKNKLITDFNTGWKDLSEEIGIDKEYIEAVKTEYDRNTEPILRHSALDAESPVNNEIAGQARNDVGEKRCNKGQARNDEGQKRCSKGQARNDEGVLNLIQYRNINSLKAALPSAEELQNELLNFEREHGTRK